MLKVSTNFSNAEKADVNQIAGKVYLVLGDYASAAAYGSTASASGSDGSGNFPASGAIDGDRTELNVGAASTADNDIGLSSWKSATAPSVTPQTLTINFGVSRTINRIKLYHLSSHGLKSYKLESSPDNSVYTLISKTTDQGGTIATTNQLDTIDFSDTACQYVKLTIADTVVAADKANVVAIECYRLVDISSRVTSVKVDRSRDYKIANPIASTFSLTCDNSDRYFSPNYTPTANDVGFINSELKPNLAVIIQYGFTYGGGSPELVTVFVGNIDRLQIDSLNRQATIEGRDGAKPLINQIVSSKLKTSIDIQSAIQYALNLCNISNYEMSLDSTGVTIDYFFINNQSVLTVLRDLVQAAGDATFYFSESGIATFRDFLNSVSGNSIITSESDWEAGTVLTNVDTVSNGGAIQKKWFLLDNFVDNNFSSNPLWTNRAAASSSTQNTEAQFEAGTVLTNIDTTSVPNQIGRKWFLIDDFTDGNATSNPHWNGLGSWWSVTSGALKLIPSTGSSALFFIDTPFANPTGTGTWSIKVSQSAINSEVRFYFMPTSIVNDFNSAHIVLSGYVIRINWSSNAIDSFITLSSVTNGNLTDLIKTGMSPDSSVHTLTVTRDANGHMVIYYDGTQKGEATDTTYTSCQDISLAASNNGQGAFFTFDDIYYSPTVLTSFSPTNTLATFESSVIDQSANIVTEGIFNATSVIPSGSFLSILYFTATSPDNVTYDAYVPATPGSPIASSPQRYIKYKVVLTTPSDNNVNASTATPSVQSVTINWTTNGWSASTGSLVFNPKTSSSINGIDIPFSKSIGTWRTNLTMVPGSGSGQKARIYILNTGFDTPTGTYLSGYYAQIDQAAGVLGVYKIDSGGTRTLLSSTAQAVNTSVHSVRFTRNSSNALVLYWDEVAKVTISDSSFSSSAVFSFEVDPNADTNGTVTFDDVYYSNQVDGSGSINAVQSIYESSVIDMTASVTSLGIFQATATTPTGSSISYFTATSADNTTYAAYVAVTNFNQIASAVNRYLKFKIVLTCPIDDGNHNANVTTPVINDVTVNWFVIAGSSKYPSSVSYVFKYSDVLMDIKQEYSDSLGGDSSILNDVNVQAKPLYLSGTSSDTQWQGTVQSPPVAISAGNPLSVTNGQVLTYAIVLSSGMDTGSMSGGTPAAVAITFAGGGAGTYKFTRINPTHPILQITITGTGTITDLRVIGKSFSNSSTISQQNVKNTASIILYGNRQLNISNPYIVNVATAATIATRLISNYKDPIIYVPSTSVRPTFSAQLNDRVTIVDDNTNINGDFLISGITHSLEIGVSGVNCQTDLLLLKVI